MKKQTLVSLAIGSAFTAAALTPVAHAAENPFGASKLQSGYQLAEADTKQKDAKCGADKKTEAKCGADKKAAEKKTEAKCGADKKADGKAGEAACGANKK